MVGVGGADWFGSMAFSNWLVGVDLNLQLRVFKGERLSGRVVRKREPVSLKCSEGPVTGGSRSTSVCVEGELVNKNCKGSPPV